MILWLIKLKIHKLIFCKIFFYWRLIFYKKLKTKSTKLTINYLFNFKYHLNYTKENNAIQINVSILMDMRCIINSSYFSLEFYYLKWTIIDQTTFSRVQNLALTNIWNIIWVGKSNYNIFILYYMVFTILLTFTIITLLILIDPLIWDSIFLFKPIHFYWIIVIILFQNWS